jgi:hypothetical protein
VRWNITLLIQFMEKTDPEDADRKYIQSELIRTAPLSVQQKKQQENFNRRMKMKDKIKKYLDNVVPGKRERESRLMQHSIGKKPILQGLTGLVSGGNAPTPLEGVDVPMAHPLP